MYLGDPPGLHSNAHDLIEGDIFEEYLKMDRPVPDMVTILTVVHDYVCKMSEALNECL